MRTVRIVVMELSYRKTRVISSEEIQLRDSLLRGAHVQGAYKRHKNR